LNKAASIAVDWVHADGATFENTKTELIHHSPGRSDLPSLHYMKGQRVWP
jgi:hypothetical protein